MCQTTCVRSCRVTKRGGQGRRITVFRNGALVRLPALSAAISIQGQGTQFICDYLNFALGSSRNGTGVSPTSAVSRLTRDLVELDACVPRGDDTVGMEVIYSPTHMSEETPPAPMG